MAKQKIDKKGIIRQSLTVFKTKGYAGATMADIAGACGLLKGSIYHYFPSKEILLEEVIQALHDYYKREVFALADDEGIDAREKLNQLTALSTGMFIEEQKGCLMANIGLETAHVFPGFTMMIRNFFEDWIVCLQKIFSSKMSEKDARLLAEQSVAEIEGAVLLMQLYDDRKFLDQAHQHIIDHFENYKNS